MQRDEPRSRQAAEVKVRPRDGGIFAQFGDALFVGAIREYDEWGFSNRMSDTAVAGQTLI